VNINISILLGLGVILTWSFEALGGYIKEYGRKINRQLTCVTLVQAIGVFSRLGYFFQAYGIAWVIDTNSFQNTRTLLVIYCELLIVMGYIILHFYGGMLSRFLFNIYSNLGIIDAATKIGEADKKILTAKTPKLSQVVGYFFLYFGAFSPFYIQMINPNYAARSVALSGIISGVSSVILISYMDVKYANQVEMKGHSVVQEELLGARYTALLILIALQFLYIAPSLKKLSIIF
jgi:hypothetical protein